MTMNHWFHYQRLLAYYEEEESRSNTNAAICFAMMGFAALAGIFLAYMNVAIWWIVALPAFAFMAFGISHMTNASYARDMMESIRWRMI